ncbi:MAG: anaerobic ribonucleoside-triphosphate reductase activating protein [Syntrophomonadaceae bacterium]|jgi:pyruvate formate lyase activating enzyme
MMISGLVKQSLIDYPGEIAAVLFTKGCSFRCPFCHNPHLLNKTGDGLIDTEQVMEFLKERIGFLDGVVITGGEPTLQKDLLDLIGQIKSIGYKVKLDTNGSSSEMIKQLLDRRLVDCVAMDIKAPLEFNKYSRVCARISREEFMQVRNTLMLLLRQSEIEVIFRTTVVPVLHSKQDIVEISKSIAGSSMYYIQQFNPEKVLDPSYRNVVPYTPAQLEEMAESCRQFVREVKVINL